MWTAQAPSRPLGGAQPEVRLRQRHVVAVQYRVGLGPPCGGDVRAGILRTAGLPPTDPVDALDHPVVPLLGLFEHRDRSAQRRVRAALTGGADGVFGEPGHPAGHPVVAAGRQVMGQPGLVLGAQTGRDAVKRKRPPLVSDFGMVPPGPPSDFYSSWSGSPRWTSTITLDRCAGVTRGSSVAPE
jgi:hypothetical protein